MNSKNSKSNVVSHIHRIIKAEHNGYKDMPLAYNLSNLYFFTVTPKGEDQMFSYYLEDFRNKIYLLKPLNFAYYVKERENTDHLHGVISIKQADYKFKKMDCDSFIFRATPLKSLIASCVYMDKHHPTILYKLQVIKFHTHVSCETHPVGRGLQRKNMYHEIKLCLPIA